MGWDKQISGFFRYQWAETAFDSTEDDESSGSPDPKLLTAASADGLTAIPDFESIIPVQGGDVGRPEFAPQQQGQASLGESEQAAGLSGDVFQQSDLALTSGSAAFTFSPENLKKGSDDEGFFEQTEDFFKAGFLSSWLPSSLSQGLFTGKEYLGPIVHAAADFAIQDGRLPISLPFMPKTEVSVPHQTQQEGSLDTGHGGGSDTDGGPPDNSGGSDTDGDLPDDSGGGDENVYTPIVYSYAVVGTSGGDTLTGGTALDVNNITIQNGHQPWSYNVTDDVMRFEVHVGDRWEKDGVLPKERSEIAVLDRLEFEETYLISFSIMIEPGDNNTADWLTLFQIQSNFDQGEPGHSPAVELVMIGEQMGIVTRYDSREITPDNNDADLSKTRQYLDTEDVTRGQWYDFNVVVKLDPFGNGSLQVYRDNALLVDYQGALGFNDALGHDWKQGVYRETSDEVMAANYKGLTITHIDNSGTSLYGGDGDDVVFGGAGNDIINGGAGQDILYGGAGADTFVFDALTAFNGIDTVKDFSFADGDAIDVNDLLIGYNEAQSSIDDFVILGYGQNEIIVSVDRDGGAGGYSPQVIAILQTAPNSGVDMGEA